MKKYIYQITVFVALLFSISLFCEVKTNAATKNITMDKASDWEWDYDNFHVGDTGQIFVDMDYNQNYYNTLDITYTSSNPKILTVDTNGTYKVIGSGKAYISIQVDYELSDRFDSFNSYGSFNSTYGFNIYDDFSRTYLSKSSVTLYMPDGYSANVEIPFVNPPAFAYYDYSFTSSNKKMNIDCSIDTVKKSLIISSYSTGTTSLTLTINGRIYIIKVSCKKVSINKTTALIVKGKKTTLKLKNYKAKKWYSSNRKVATVSSKGTVKGKSKGNAVIYTVVNGQKIGCAVSVVTKKMKKVIAKAKKIAKGKYSQAKRMQKNYYDCSSLVWRAYASQKIYLVDRHYAPVAANLCKGLIKKKIKGGYSYKNFKKMKLRPGDLYCQGGAKNGRYKGIYHVEMFIGYRCIGFDGNSPILLPMWAARPDGYYFFDGDTIVRPRK